MFYCWKRDSDITIVVVSAVPVIGAFLNTFGNVRSAYNEHYVTALLQTGLQIGLYTIGLGVPAFRESVVRLFETFLVPVVLTPTPLSSYIRLRWNDHSSIQWQPLTRVTLELGIGYGVAGRLDCFTRLYVDHMLHLSQPGGLIYILPCFVLFGAVVAYRTYALVAYVVSNQSRHLSYWSTLAVFAALAAGVAVQRLIAPLGVIAVYAVTAGAARGAANLIGPILLLTGHLLWRRPARFRKVITGLVGRFQDIVAALRYPDLSRIVARRRCMTATNSPNQITFRCFVIETT